MQNFRMLFLGIFKTLFYYFNRSCFCTLILSGNATFSHVIFEIHETLFYYFNRSSFYTIFWGGHATFSPANFWNSQNLSLLLQPVLFFQQFWVGISEIAVLVCLVMNIYNLVVLMFTSLPKLAPFTQKVLFFRWNKRKLVPRGIVTTVLRKNRKQSGCFKIKNQRPSCRNNPKTKVSRGPIFRLVGNWSPVH